uniref:NADH-ubiquinone oxidoreductase chain 6 n=1 Tax=Schlettererius cinctipes TaxID=32424 RepID=C4NCG5_9HYME|nr:NADH dehydrogenase subunit 6 [Schlettererius cinctipes]
MTMLYNYLLFSMMSLMIISISLPIFKNSSNPLYLGIHLFFLTIFMMITMSMQYNSYFISFIMFLIMIGGLLIMFLYFTAISSNSIFIFDKNFYMSMIMKIMLLMILMMMLMYKIDPNLTNEFQEIMFYNINNFSITEKLNSNMLTNLFNYPTMNMSIFMMMYLIFTLLTVVKICIKINVPIRLK